MIVEVSSFSSFTQHRRNRLSLRFLLRNPRYALDDPWFFHEGRVELRWDASDHLAVVTRETSTRRGGRSRTPKVVGGVVEEVRRRLGENGGATAVLLGKDDLIEELDLWVIWPNGFPLVDEFIEGYMATVSTVNLQGMVRHQPCVCCSMAKYSAFSLGILFKNPSMLK